MSQTELPGSVPCGLARLPSRYARIATLLFCGWILIVLVHGARMAYQSVRESLAALGSAKIATQVGVSLAPSVPDAPVTYAAAALVIYSVVVLAILLSQFVRPRLTAAVAVLVPVSIFVLAVISTGAVAAALAACAVLATSWLAGDIIVRMFRAPISNVHLAATTSIRIAMGLGGLGTAVLILGSFNGISLLPIVIVALVVLLTWSALNWSNLRRAFSLTPASPGAMPRLDWFETFLIALSAAFFTFAALATLTPETILTASDSVRQHLPQAREIWQDHAVLFYPTLESFSASVLGASVNSVAFGLGGFTAVRILQVLVSLCCLIAIAGLGATLAGRLAGIAGAAFFSAMPLVLWLSGHAYPDLLAVLFVCASVQCAICWQHDGHRSWLLMSGALAGFSMATKQISAVVVVALLLALALSGRPGATFSDRAQAILLLGFACLVATIPWFVHSAILTGRFPLLGTLLGQLDNVPVLATISNGSTPGATGSTPAVPPATVAEVFPGGVTRTFAGIVTGPWDLTFQGAYANWRSVRHGEFGILLLMFFPLIFVNLCSRGFVLVAITTMVSFVAWVFTIQVPRHLLPSLALLAVLVGIAAAHASRDLLTSTRTPYGRLVQVASIAGLALTPLFYLPNTSTFFPITVLTGSTRSEDYLASADPATSALKAATALLPADTRVGYIGEWLGTQSSTEARLIYLGQYSANARDSLNGQVGDSPDAIFESFDKLEIRYFIWDRADTRPQDIDAMLLSGEFLLNYTSIVGGDNGVYLFEVHPEGVADPTLQENLIQDPAFANLRKAGNVWNGSKRDLSGSGALQPRRQKQVSQRVEITSGHQYLLVLDGSCDSTKDRTSVSLTWRDGRDNIIGSTADTLALGTNSNSALMWRRAPDDATTVDVGISTANGTPCRVKQIGMFAYGNS